MDRSVRWCVTARWSLVLTPWESHSVSSKLPALLDLRVLLRGERRTVQCDPGGLW